MKLKIITATVAVLLVFLAVNSAVTNAQIEPTTTNPETGLPELPDVDIELPQIIPTVDIGKRVQDVMDLWDISGLLDIFNVAEAGAMIDSCVDLTADLINNLLPALIQSGFNLGSITGFCGSLFSSVLAVANALCTTVVGVFTGGGLIGSLVGVGVSALNIIGSVVIGFLTAIGLTAEGILALLGITSLVSLVIGAAAFVISIIGDVLNFAYTSGVAGIAVVALLLVVLSFVGLAVLGGAILVVALIEVALFIMVLGVLVVNLFTLGIFAIVSGAIIAVISFFAGIGFLVIGILSLIAKLVTSLMNTVSVPTSIFTAIPSWLGTLCINLPGAILPAISSFCGAGFSCFSAVTWILWFLPFFASLPLIAAIFIVAFIVTIVSALLGAVITGFLGILFGGAIGLIVGAIAGVIVAILGGVILAVLGFIVLTILLGVLTGPGFIVGMIIGPIIGIILGIIIGIVLDYILVIACLVLGAIAGAIAGALLFGIITAIIVGIIALIISIITFFVSIILFPLFGVLVNALIFPLTSLFISFIASACISLVDFGSIIADAITGFAGLIITGITLMLLRVGIDLMQTALISEIVTVLVLFLQKLQEISFLTKMAAYPIEVCVGITMLCAAVGMFLLNILLYPFNFVWQFVDMCLKGCYGLVCKPFIRPLGWE